MAKNANVDDDFVWARADGAAQAGNGAPANGGADPAADAAAAAEAAPQPHNFRQARRAPRRLLVLPKRCSSAEPRAMLAECERIFDERSTAA
jgi:hypothetical protein